MRPSCLVRPGRPWHFDPRLSRRIGIGICSREGEESRKGGQGTGILYGSLDTWKGKGKGKGKEKLLLVRDVSHQGVDSCVTTRLHARVIASRGHRLKATNISACYAHKGIDSLQRGLYGRQFQRRNCGKAAILRQSGCHAGAELVYEGSHSPAVGVQLCALPFCALYARQIKILVG